MGLSDDMNSSVPFLIASQLISLGSSITFIVLFIMYTGDEAANVSCHTLINWDKGLYISLIITTVASFFKTILIVSGEAKSGLTGAFTCLVATAGLSTFVCWIGVQAVYFNLEVSGVCNNLGKLNFAYIIFTYAMIGVMFIMCFCVCFCATMFLASTTHQVQNSAQADYAEYQKQHNAGE